MITLFSLKNETRKGKKVKRVGRGVSSQRGKTSCRGQKGNKARSGYKRRLGNEGGRMKLYRKLPCRGFTRGRFIKPSLSINFSLIDRLYSDGEVVNYETLRQKGYVSRRLPGGIKILAKGKMERKVRIEANGFSKQAIKKLEEKKIAYKILE